MERHSHNHFAYVVMSLLVDVGLILGLSELVYRFFWPVASVPELYRSLGVICALSWLAVANWQKLYSRAHLFAEEVQLDRFPLATLAHLGVLAMYLVGYAQMRYPPSYLLLLLVCQVFALGSWRILGVWMYKYRRLLRRDYHPLIVGAGPLGENLRQFFERIRTPATVLALPGPLTMTRLHDLQAYCLSQRVSELYLTVPVAESQVLASLLEFADTHFLYVRVVKDPSGLTPSVYEQHALLDDARIRAHLKPDPQRVDVYDSMPVVTLKNYPLRPMLSGLTKRVLDVGVSLFAVLGVLLPLTLLLAPLIRLESPGPVFFRQRRAGRGNQPFWCYKFRTMYATARDQPFRQATQHDPRVTKIGRWLRRSGLDELPQFLNVLQGHMSVVGPRPHPLPLDDVFVPEIERYTYRYFIKPGITGYAQVNGLRGETATHACMQQRVLHDIWYIEHWSLWLDLHIMWRTTRHLLTKEPVAY